jgi:nucleoside-diphosphate-sugar epimerase
MLSLVTGGAGFLGSHLVDALVVHDDVIIVDNLSTGSLANIEHVLRDGRTTFIYLDVAAPLTHIKTVIAKAVGSRAIDRIFHFASPSGVDTGGGDWWETLRANAVGTMSLIDLAIEQRARLIFASSSTRFCESAALEDGPRCDDSAKRFAEDAISAARTHRGLDGRIVRFDNCYGPRMNTADGRLVSSLTTAVSADKPMPIHGDGRQTCSMVFVEDAIGFALAAANAAETALAPVEIEKDAERPVIEIAQSVARVAGVSLALELDASDADAAAAERAPQRARPRSVSYTPRTSLDDGLAKTFAWLRNRSGAYV